MVSWATYGFLKNIEISMVFIAFWGFGDARVFPWSLWYRSRDHFEIIKSILVPSEILLGSLGVPNEKKWLWQLPE